MAVIKVDRRIAARAEREARLVAFITEGRAVSAVALLEVVSHDYAYKLLMKVSKKFGLNYRPRRVANTAQADIPGLTDDSQAVRARLGDLLYTLKGSQPELARLTGVASHAQLTARDRPFNYDWSLSQIERLAKAANTDFRALMLQALLAPAEFQKVRDA